jgi:predicted phosphodiesterase
VLSDIASLHVDVIFCAGDIFGYYPWAQKTYDLIKEYLIEASLGNHDALVLNSLDLLSKDITIVPDAINGPIYDVAENNASDLTSSAREWLSSLNISVNRKIDDWEITMLHGTPDNPLEGRLYPDTGLSADWLPGHKQILVLGHTHYPLMRRYKNGGILLNPGSVGQPRDGNPFPSWIYVDTDQLCKTKNDHPQLRRVAYDQFHPMKMLERRRWPERFVRALNKTSIGRLR